MKRTFLGLLVSVAMTGTMVAAQDAQVPSPGQSQANPASQSRPTPRDPAIAPSSTSATETTITGCLVQGSGPTVFLLKDAKTTAAAATTSAAGAMTTARASGGSASVAASDPSGASVQATVSVDRGTTYRLEMDKGVELKTHLNHQVSITGKLDSKASTTTAAAAGAVDKMDEKSLAKFTATSVTKVADTCSAVG